MDPAQDFAPRCPNHADVTAGLRTCARCGRDFCDDCLVELRGSLTCAGCKQETLRDLRSGSAELDYAGAGKRFVGSVVDGILFAVPAALAMFALAFGRQSALSFGESSLGVVFFISIGFLLYDALMTANGGQTLGKKLAGTKVVTVEGNDVSSGQAWARAGSRMVMQLTRVLGLVDALFVFSERRRTLHDRIARTVVVNWH
jgi:uncharacterized RDD family membrane protein YckC